MRRPPSGSAIYWKRRIVWLVGPLAALAVDCARPQPAVVGSAKGADAEGRPAPTSSRAPRLTQLVPDSARVPDRCLVEVIVRGSGFTPGPEGANVITLGPVLVRRVVANAEGTELRFEVPYQLPNATESGPRPLRPGTYDVTVSTASGTSNTLHFRVLP